MMNSIVHKEVSNYIPDPPNGGVPWEPVEMICCEQCRHCSQVDVTVSGVTGTVYICTADEPMQVDESYKMRIDDCADFES